MNSAKRGDLVVVIAEHSCMSLEKGSSSYITYELGIASKVNRAGVVKEATTFSYNTKVTVNSGVQIYTVSQNLINVTAVQEKFHGRSWLSLDEIRETLRPMLHTA
jgi:hypothetical protein